MYLKSYGTAPGCGGGGVDGTKMLKFYIKVYISGRGTVEHSILFTDRSCSKRPGRVSQSVGHLTRKSGVLGSIPGLATYFRFSFRFFKNGSCQLLAKVSAQSTG